MNSQLQQKEPIQNSSRKDQLDDLKFKLVKQHFSIQYKQAYKYSGKPIHLSLVAFYLLFSFAKYLACFYSLNQRDDQCDVNPLYIWLTIAGMYEFFNSIRYLTILYSLQFNSKDIFLLVLADMLMKDSPLSLDGLEEKNRRSQIKRLIKSKLQERDISPIDSPLDPPFNLWDIIHQSEALNKYTRVMKVYNQFIYYLIFTGGNVAYFSSDANDCDNQLNNVTFLLLLIGYLFSAFLIVGFGLAILSMALYLPVILFLFLFQSLCKLFKRIQTRNKCNKMKTTKFRKDECDFTQCNICMLDYCEGDKTIQLPCSHRHHFHKTCLTQWLLIKQQCPVCRKAI